jgi:hypothetical protein
VIDRDVVSITRSVIVERGFPCAVVSVTPVASGWEIRVRNQHGGGVATVSISVGRPTDIRVALEEQLDALFDR